MKQKKGKKKLIKRIIIITVIIILLALCIIPNVFSKGEVVPSVNVVQAVTGDVEEVLDTSGTVKSENTKSYFSPVNAKISKCNIEAGSIVKKGDMLLEYDMDDLQEQYEKATLQTQATTYGNQIQIDASNKSSQKASEAATEIANLESQISAKESEIASVQEQISSASSSSSSSASETATKITSLKKEATKISKKKIDTQSEIDGYLQKQTSGTITDKETKKLKELQGNMVTWEKREVEITAELEILTVETPDISSSSELQTQLETLNQELAMLEQDLATQKSTKSSAEDSIINSNQKAQFDAQEQLAEYDVMSADELLEKAKGGISSDFDGIVTAVTAVKGATVAQGEQLFTIAQSDSIQVEISLSKYDLEKVQLDQKATITIGGNEYKGTLTKINRIAETNEKGATLVKAQVHVDNPDDNIIIGIEAKVKINIASVKDVLIVPVQAINSGQDGNFCYVVEDSAIVKKSVTTGVASTEYMEIIEGLTQGEQVVTDIAAGIEEGSVVKASEQDNQVMKEESKENKENKESKNNEETQVAE